ncbi:MAG: exonuclease SbcCD subunit D [Hyphomonadaceae bacterium]|nr:exonuclease SbcCD subunit D [Hyphomonadaceae bacterium]
MKILHTSDWHLGRQFHGQPLEADHAHVLEQVLDAVRTHRPDALIIAGDIFDRASPPAEAVRLFNSFVERFSAGSDAAIVLIAGNHDSGDRLASLAALADRRRVLIRGPLISEERPLIITDAHGPVAFSALPFGNEFAARECFPDACIAKPSDVIAAQVAAARAHVPAGARWVIVAHAFVANACASESERPISVGGVDTVHPEAFNGAHYVALGHLHRPQFTGKPHIRYSGSPLAFSFDEGEAQKSMCLVDLKADGAVTHELLPFTPLRRVRTITGLFAGLLATAAANPSDDFLEIVLTDQGAIVDAMGRLRQHYPNALRMRIAAMETASAVTPSKNAVIAVEPMPVIEEFFTHVRGTGLHDDERVIVESALGRAHATELAA